MSSSPQQTSAQPGAGAKFDPFDLSSLKISEGSVLRDGYMPPADAQRIWRKFCGDTGIDITTGVLRLAVSCCSGTSAETNLTERLLDVNDRRTAVSGLVNLMMSDPYLATRPNKLRVFCRSLPGFALITRQVILANPWLARQVASEYEVDVSVAGVCFDYADALTKIDVQLTPTEMQTIKHGLKQKAGEGRSVAYGAEGNGVPGSAPRDRGVTPSLVVSPNAGRVSGRGSGPYA